MTYSERNAGLVTSHKLKSFDRCPWCFAREFIDMIPNPANEDNDNFVVGAALDSLLSDGQKSYNKQYEVVTRRSKGGRKIQLTNTMGKLVDQMTEEYLANGLFGMNLTKRRLNKQRLTVEFGGLTLSGEVDHLDEKKREFVDLKTTVNILKADEAIDKYDYVFQMAFYHFLLEEIYGERFTCRMFLVDKFPYFSRSRCYEVSQLSMLHERKRLPQLLERYKQAEDTGMYLPSGGPDEREDHPYYWINGHGRRRNTIII